MPATGTATAPPAAKQSAQEVGTKQVYTKFIQTRQCSGRRGLAAGQELAAARGGSPGTNLEGCILRGAALHPLPKLIRLIAGCRAEAGVVK